MSTPGSFPAGTSIPPRQRLSLAEKVVRAIVFVLGAAGVLAVCWVLRFLLVPIVVAFLFTSVMGPLADRLENRGVSRSLSVTAVFGLLLGRLATVAVGVWPSIESWLEQAPQEGERSAFEVQLEQRLDAWQAALSARYRQIDWHAAFEKLRHVLQAQRKSLVEGLPAMALGLLSNAGSVVLALIIAFFVMLDGASMKRSVVSLVPNRHFENALVMLDRVDRLTATVFVERSREVFDRHGPGQRIERHQHAGHVFDLQREHGEAEQAQVEIADEALRGNDFVDGTLEAGGDEVTNDLQLRGEVGRG